MTTHIWNQIKTILYLYQSFKISCIYNIYYKYVKFHDMFTNIDKDIRTKQTPDGLDIVGV